MLLENMSLREYRFIAAVHCKVVRFYRIIPIEKVLLTTGISLASREVEESFISHLGSFDVWTNDVGIIDVDHISPAADGETYIFQVVFALGLQLSQELGILKNEMIHPFINNLSLF